MANNVSGIRNKAEGQKLHIVTSFKYIGAIVSNGGSFKDCTSLFSSEKSEASIEKITTYLSKQR